MKMEFWTKSKVHRDAIAARSSLLERIEYIVDHADKPKYRAMAMINIEAGAEFYCPRLGPFTIREFSRLMLLRSSVCSWKMAAIKVSFSIPL
jgi:hypothetical protein